MPHAANSLLTALALVSAPAAQATWYVDAAGVPPGSGTTADPYTSIQYALDQPATVDGDTLAVAPGTYTENLVLPVKQVTIHAVAGPEATILEPAGPGHLVTAPDFANPVLSGFTLTGVSGDFAAFWAPVSGSRATLSRCVVTGNDIAVWSQYDLILESCSVVDNGIAVRLTGPNLPSVVAQNCVFWESGSYEAPGFFSTFHCVGDMPFPNPPGDQSVDPLLWDVAGGDFRPAPGSPVIDAGEPFLTDADGSVLDVGAYAYDPAYAPAPATYCTPKLASDGCLATIGFQGAAPESVPSASAPEPFLVTASGVSEQKNGLFFFGLGASAFPFQGGWFCIAPPTARTGFQNSGTAGAPCSGTFALDVNELVQSGVYPFLGPGVMLYGQYWFRDPADPFQSIRTDAIRLGIAE